MTLSAKQIQLECSGAEVRLILKQETREEARAFYEQLLSRLESGTEFRIVLKAGQKV